MAASPSTFTCKDEPVENLRPLKARVIGAGYAGPYLGVRIPQRLRNIDFRIFEKNDGVGDVWYEKNIYPGCACDIPAHLYQYTFAPNPSWAGLYAGSGEICEYLQATSKRYGVVRSVKLSHKMTKCLWNDDEKKWWLKVKNTSTGEVFEESVDIVVACRGNLNDTAWPADANALGGEMNQFHPKLVM